MYRELAAAEPVLRRACGQSTAVAADASSGDGEPERLEGQRVSASYFHVLGVSPSLGRDFSRRDDRPGGPNVVILSDALWRGASAATPRSSGARSHLDGDPYTVIGVMPRGFRKRAGAAAELWAPLQYNAHRCASRAGSGDIICAWSGGCGPGSRLEQARRELDAIARTPVADFRAARVGLRSGAGSLVHSLQIDVTRGVRPALLAMLGAVALVLAIACVNVTNLLLARGAQRRGEFALRAALGAGPSRLIRQLLTESLVLAACGGVLGVRRWRCSACARCVALSPPGLPRVGAIGLNAARVRLRARRHHARSGSAVGVMPALQAARAICIGGALQQRLAAHRRRARGARGARWSSPRWRSRWCCS